MIPISAERKAQLEEFAHRRGLDTAAVLDDVLDEYLAWERRDFQEAVEGIREGYEDIRVGRAQAAEEMFEELRVRHGLPRSTSQKANRDLHAILNWLLAEEAGETGLRWFQGLRDAIASLS